MRRRTPMRALYVDGAVGQYIHTFYATSGFVNGGAHKPALLLAGQKETQDGIVGLHFWGTPNLIIAVGCSLVAPDGDSWQPVASAWIGRLLVAANLYSSASVYAQPIGTPVAVVDRSETLLPKECSVTSMAKDTKPVALDQLNAFMASYPAGEESELFLALLAEAHCNLIPVHYRMLSLMRIVELLQKSEKTQHWMDQYDQLFTATGLSTRRLRKAYPELRTRIAHGYSRERIVYTAWTVDKDPMLIILYDFLHQLIESEAARRGLINLRFTA